MTRARAVLATGCSLALLAAGCHGDPPLQETLLIAGNSAMARHLEPLVKEFKVRNPKANVVCEPGGTVAAVIALKRGAIDVAALSRLVSPDEDDPRLRDYQVCRDALGIVVHNDNPVSNLTLKQLDALFDGTYTSWNQVGGPDTPVHLYVRDQEAPISRSFNEMALGGDEPFAGAHAVKKSADMIAAIKGDPGAIGYLALKHVKKAGDFKVLKIEGIEMNRLTTLSGSYPLSRAFYLASTGRPEARRAVRPVRVEQGRPGDPDRGRPAPRSLSVHADPDAPLQRVGDRARPALPRGRTGPRLAGPRGALRLRHRRPGNYREAITSAGFELMGELALCPSPTVGSSPATRSGCARGCAPGPTSSTAGSPTTTRWPSSPPTASSPARPWCEPRRTPTR